MGMWKITNEGPVPVAETKLRRENLLEENLEDWIIRQPQLLGEPLWIIGRHVMIPNVKDRLDVLALDPAGNTVIIELKRGKLKDPVDMQALRYASYISKWSRDDLEREALNFLGRARAEFNFNEEYEEFCAEANVDEVPDINEDQRIILVGSEVRDKLGSVALWLSDHDIDIKVVEVEAYREGGTVFIRPNVIVPLPVNRFERVGKGVPGDGPGPRLRDGKAWHLERQCSPKTKEMLLQLDGLIGDNVEVDPPKWNAKRYVAYPVANHNWLTVTTHPTLLELAFTVKRGSFDQSHLASRLGLQEFNKELSLKEKLSLPSSVLVWEVDDTVDRVRLRVKEGFDLGSEAFLRFLREAHQASPRSAA
jgi:hypothetical protein